MGWGGMGRADMGWKPSGFAAGERGVAEGERPGVVRGVAVGVARGVAVLWVSK